MRLWTSKEISLLRSDYPTRPTRELAAELDRNISAVRQKAGRLGLKKIGRPGYRSQASKRKYRVNEKALETLTPKTAYVVGFVLADGWVGEGRIGISNANTITLAKVRNALGCSHKFNLERKGDHTIFSVAITNKKLASSFADLGFGPNKSLEGRMPAVPDELFWHFLRGYFDGDGSSRYSLRGGLQIRFVSGSRLLLVDIAEKISSLADIPLARVTNDKGRPTANRLSYSGRAAATIGRLMYHDAGDLYIQRKREPFIEYANRPTKREKLTEAQVVEIKKLASEGLPQASIARRFSVSSAAISMILRGERWKSVVTSPEKPPTG